jgi:hypothetical protein
MAHGEPVLHRSGGGQLRIHKPLPPALEEEPPPEEEETDAPDEEEEEQPQRRTRFPRS